ncbi:MAG: Omp28-related outer membrane protein [Flavobacteriales bacterium]|nr:Omp28-related outer membrane protein [Flavobacteriales bacterium]
MKKLFALTLLLPSLAFGQSLVGTDAELRTGFLEDFTGVNCVNCPDGHTIMASVAAAHPGLVSLVGVHAGIYSTPEFQTTFGTALDNFYNPSGYPMGVVNRRPYNGVSVMGRGSWAAAMDEVLALPSPVNLGMESSYDAGSQILTVHVQLHYTADSPGGEDRIGVLLTENHIFGYQSGGGSNYDHTHVLRTYLTDIWGESVTTTTAGTTVDRTYTLAVPATWNIDNCEVTAFVSEVQADVYQARTVPAVDGTTLVIGSLVQDAAPYRSGANAVANTFNASVTNALGADGEYIVSLTALDAPASWATALELDGNTIASGTTTSLSNAATAQIAVNITPDAAAGVGNYMLTIASAEYPMAPVLQQDLHVISGVHDLIVTNPQAEPWDALYTTAMTQSWETAYAKVSKDVFLKFAEADALNDVLNIYRNVSWTFPSLTDDEVAWLTTFMDNGGNLFIAGQDVGWDQSGAVGAYGTAATQAFFHSHMLANFVADGSSSSNTANFTDADAVFGTVPNSSIANVFGGNTYPDQITPIAPATSILTYNAGSTIGGIRGQTDNFKVVYFGVGPEQMSNAAVGRQMIQLSHDWFYGTVSVQEFDNAIGSLGQAYPVPADGLLNIPVSALKEAATLEVFDAMGRLVITQAAAPNALLELNTRTLGNGMYSYRLRTATSVGTARAFSVAH